MNEAENVDADLEFQGTVDWANSIQLRQAEKVAGHIARQSGGGTMHPGYRDKLLTVALQAGLEQDLVQKMFAENNLPRLGDLDEADVRSVCSSAVESLVTTMNTAGMDTAGRKLLVWSLASGQINAMCATNTWDTKHYNIFVDTDLVVFCNIIGKIFAECLVIDNVANGAADPGISTVERIVLGEDMQARVTDLFEAAIMEGSVRAAKPWAPSPQALRLTVLLSNSLLLFPLAHELGHLHLQHLEKEDTEELAVADHADLVAKVYSHESEFEADAVGSIVAMQTAIRIGVSNAYTVLAPYIFLKTIEILDVCAELFEYDHGGFSFTHPAATERVRRIREVIRLHLAYHSSGKAVPAAIGQIDRIAHWMLVVTTRHLNQLKEAGRTPRETVRLRVSELEAMPGIVG